MTKEEGNGGKRALLVGNERRDRGIARKQGRKHPPQGSRSSLVATDIAGQRDNAETGDRRLLQADHVVTQEPGRQWHDHLLRFARMTKPPNRSKARAHHEQRRVVAKILRCVRCFVCIEICRAREQEPGRWLQRPLDQGRIRESVYLDANETPHTPQDLRSHPSLFMMRTGLVPVWRLRHSSKAKEVVMPLAPRLLSDDMIGLKQAAIAGLGVVALPGYVCRDEVRSGTLRRIVASLPYLYSTIHSAHPL